jgi:hypothetical protein
MFEGERFDIPGMPEGRRYIPFSAWGGGGGGVVDYFVD